MGVQPSSGILSRSQNVSLPTGVPVSGSLNVVSDSSRFGGLFPRARPEDLRVFPRRGVEELDIIAPP